MGKDEPFFQHHHKTLHNEALGYLRDEAFVQPKNSFVLHNVDQDFCESAKGHTLALRWGLRLQHGFRHDERMRGDGSQNL